MGCPSNGIEFEASTVSVGNLITLLILHVGGLGDIVCLVVPINIMITFEFMAKHEDTLSIFQQPEIDFILALTFTIRLTSGQNAAHGPHTN